MALWRRVKLPCTGNAYIYFICNKYRVLFFFCLIYFYHDRVKCFNCQLHFCLVYVSSVFSLTCYCIPDLGELSQHCVYIASDGGRVCRPLVIADKGISRVKEYHMQELNVSIQFFYLPAETFATIADIFLIFFLRLGCVLLMTF